MTRFTAQSTSEEVCKDLSDQIQGSRVLITGVTPGSIGGEAAMQISRHSPALLILAGRTIEKLQAIEGAIKAETPGANTRLLTLDLSSQESIRKAAEEVNALPDQVDILINNAGTMATPYGVTKEGLELQFGTNHIGHFLFTNLILSKKELGHQVKVINVSSLGHKRGHVRFDDYNFQDGKCYDKWQAYGQSKTANILFSVSLAKKLGDKGVKSFSLYPGRIETGIGRHLHFEEWVKAGWKHEDGAINYDIDDNWRTLSEAAATLIVAAYDPSIEDSNGSYMVKNQVNNSEAADYAVDPKNAEKLWALSEDLVGQKFSY
ncbi:Retinol dehydrogenase 14 [Talaromyces islandicus]|uniref:Retinol dehydrogenase 14 n=1 Tax=Talaromyces islandicus TaxID=28573 RepID=A0A0U1LIZ6_TALIS|nr:Retinol dehydrogenase 14 [Talaromyces islandicus]